MSDMNDAAVPATDYAAVIIAYHRPDLLRAVLTRLRSQTQQPGLIVVVDNGGDVDEAMLSETGTGPVVIRREDNPGYATAVNLAVELADSKGLTNLLVLTHDAVFSPALAISLSTALAADSRAGCAAPTLRWVSDPDRIFSSGGVLTRGGRAYHRIDEVGDRPRAAHWVDGAVAMYRVGALRDIGGLDERYFLYFEDVDTGWSLARSGWRTLVVSEIAQQEPGAHPLRLGLRNMVLFARKAKLPAILVGAAIARRAAEEIVVSFRRERRIHLLLAMRGIVDGVRGKQGKP